MQHNDTDDEGQLDQNLMQTLHELQFSEKETTEEEMETIRTDGRTDGRHRRHGRTDLPDHTIMCGVFDPKIENSVS